LNDRMGSDHHPALVKLRNLRPTPGAGPGMRKVWRTDKIPHYKDKASKPTRAPSAPGLATPGPKFMPSGPRKLTMISNLVEHSFEKCLHEVTNTVLGKRSVGPSAVPRMTTAIKVLNSQRLACELGLRVVVQRKQQ